eukprot:43781-Eustigmatos_ZCMA.PRE.1
MYKVVFVVTYGRLPASTKARSLCYSIHGLNLNVRCLCVWCAQDETPPVITCPLDATAVLPADASTVEVALGAATANDNVGVETITTNDLPSNGFVHGFFLVRLVDDVA